jgi:hypothetical protein
MNRKNAKYEGHKDGRLYQSNGPLSKKEYMEAGERITPDKYGVSLKTLALYQSGWIEAYLEPLQVQPEQTIAHNPNTRFCDCNTCMENSQ